MQTKKVRINGKPMNPKDENEVIGPGKPNEVNAHEDAELVKGIREPKESKWAKDAQKKNKRDTGAHK